MNILKMAVSVRSESAVHPKKQDDLKVNSPVQQRDVEPIALFYNVLVSVIYFPC